MIITNIYQYDLFSSDHCCRLVTTRIEDHLAQDVIVFFSAMTCSLRGMFWQEGRCQRGAMCKYAHGEEELRAACFLAK